MFLIKKKKKNGKKSVLFKHISRIIHCMYTYKLQNAIKCKIHYITRVSLYCSAVYYNVHQNLIISTYILYTKAV